MPSPMTRLALAVLLVPLLALAAHAAPKPADPDHDLDAYEDNSKNPEVLLRAYAHNSHLQKLLDLGLYQVVFDDDPEGVTSFLAAGAHIEGLKGLPLTPMQFATWRHENRTVHTLVAHGARTVDETTDPDQLVRLTVDTVTGVSDLVKKEMVAAELEYRRQPRGR